MGQSKGNDGSGDGSTAGVQKVKKPKPPYNLGSQIRSALRMAWRRHPSLQLALKRERIEKVYIKVDGSRAKLPRVFYKCASCGEEFSLKHIQLDHVNPVGPTPGSKLAPPRLDWNMFIAKLFCGPENLKTVCKPCHAEKTKRETQARWEAYKSAG